MCHYSLASIDGLLTDVNQQMQHDVIYREFGGNSKDIGPS